MSRYSNYPLVENDLDFYKEKLDVRYTKSIIHHRPNTATSLDYDFITNLSYVNEVWNTSIKLFKLADKYYGDPNLWWVIGLVNKKPTDAHWKNGDLIYIPIDPTPVIRMVNSNIEEYINLE